LACAVQNLRGMAMREFADTPGRRWLVWETVPACVERVGKFRGGWLTFDDGNARWRLAPVPEGREGLSDARLALLLRVARPIAAMSEYSGPERRRGERREGERRLRDRRQPP
jgi:hypothetical protein